MTEPVEKSDTNQGNPNLTTIIDKKDKNTFGQISWSLTHCFIALGVIAIFRVTFYLLSCLNRGTIVYSGGIVLWILMYCCMVFMPLWIARKKRILRQPRVGRVMKEFALAIPLVICLVLVERLGVVFLSHMSGSSIEPGPALSRLRGSPNDIRVYLLLIPAFTIGPFAEELFFRGLIYNSLRRKIGPLAAAFLQAFIFMLVHYKCPETGIIPLASVFFAGIVLAGIYEWRKTLWSPIALHVLKNLAFVVPVMALMILNSHKPAQTWLEAERPPDWLYTDLSSIEKKATGEEQRLYAINKWGSRGLRMWKNEMQGFYAVCEWFPDDKSACAQAKMGMVNIYLYYLRDFRRAIVQSDWILSEFKDQQDACAQTLLMKAQAYRELGDRAMSEQCLREVLESYRTPEWVLKAAEEELGLIESR